ncbi:hypothetical protein MKW94_012113 [Papaver nudicaule]|uniref:Red chlorophyll catabolite reductase n=1 Tax=Papaver nudicaule TaxID=74823 RepID=A0AA41S0M3_PAPNU|nr:hypothetical protein [Papaver nudicaule]
MVVLTHQFIHPFRLPPSPSSRITLKTKHNSIIITSSSSPMDPPPKFIDFPHLSISTKNLMVDLVSKTENTLSPNLLPSSLPPEVQYFQNSSATSQGCLHIRSGTNNSQVDCVLGNWIHCELPNGGALDITTLTAYLNSNTDAPRFLIEFIQNSPKSLILILDLPPRKDVVMNPEYLKTFYEETQLDESRKKLLELSEIRSYISASLYLRALSSPTAISVTIDCGESGGAARLEEIIRDHVGPIAKDMLEVWLNQCVCTERGVDESEKVELMKRDVLIKKKTVEVDLASSLPRLFGQDVANLVIEAISKAFDIL